MPIGVTVWSSTLSSEPSVFAAADGFGQLQVAAGGGVQDHELAQAVGGDAGQQLERGGLGLLQVLEDRPGGADRLGQPAQAKAVQRADLEMAQQRFLAAPGFKAPGGPAR